MSSAARTIPVSPPPIGEALGVGWTTFQEHMGPVTLGFLCALLPSLIPLVGGGLAFAGMMHVSRKALRGEAPLPSDGFVGLSQNAVDHIVMGLLQIAGLIACCVGVYVTQGLFYPGTLMILDRGITWQQAMDACREQVQPNLVQWTLFVFVVGLVGASGMLLCVVGVFLTAPVATIALAYAYERAFAAVPVTA
jgi:hypothetical protein